MLLIIGLDGADWRILNPWLQDGSLPHLAALKQRGAYSALASTIRPESSIAWTTFATGVNAGKHGIFGFLGQRPDSYALSLNTATAIRAETFWQRAATAGRRIALLNLPMTYPPQPLARGALVAGMLTPDVHSTFTHPPELRKALLAAVPDYAIGIQRRNMPLNDYIRAVTRTIEARGRAAVWLLQQDAWDAAVVVFSSTDRLQHAALHLLHPRHPSYDVSRAARELPLLRSAYQTLDAAIGRLLQEAGPDATVVALSDHGFTPAARIFYVNSWLQGQGLLVTTGKAPPPGIWQRLRRQPSLRRLKQRLPGLRMLHHPPALAPYFKTVVWEKSKVWYSPVGGLRFNIRGREPQGILSAADARLLSEELQAALLHLTDPATGGMPIAAVIPREALYHGPYTANAPDLILEPQRAGGQPLHNSLILPDFAPSAFADSHDLTGNHALDGILLAAGPHIRPGVRPQAHLLDMAPTFLHLLGVTPPEELGGKVLDWASSPSHPPENDTHFSSPPDSDTTLSTDEQAVLRDRLHELGYL